MSLEQIGAIPINKFIHDATLDVFKAKVLGKEMRAINRVGKSVIITLPYGTMWRTHLSSTGWFKQTKAAGQVQTKDRHFLHTIDTPSYRIKITLDDGQEWVYVDGRTWGRFSLLKGATPQDNPYLASYGPDWLTDPEAAGAALLMHKGNRLAKDVLCNQKLTAGIGNYLACEALFLAGIHPHTRWKQLDPRQIALVVQTVEKVVKEALVNSTKDHWRVFKREGKPCVHGSPAQSLFHVVSYVKDPGDQRGSYFCRICQGDPLGSKVVPNKGVPNPADLEDYRNRG